MLLVTRGVKREGETPEMPFLLEVDVCRQNLYFAMCFVCC